MINRRGGISFFANVRKLRSDDQKGPQHDNAAKHKIGGNHPHGFVAQVRRVLPRCFHRCDLRSSQFDAGEDKRRSNEHACNRAQGIECLAEVQAALRARRISYLRDERTRTRLKKRQSAGDHE